MELMPWQEHVLAVATEFDPDTGRPFYRQVWITVPRQSGKTTLLLIVTLVRAMAFGPRQRIIYSAQSGSDAREKFLEDWVPVLKASPYVWGKPGRDQPNGHGLARRLQTQNGHEGLDFLNGSLFRLMSSTTSSGHGKTLHLGMFDEAWKDFDLRREQALVPATNTIADAQFWGVSTMGHGDSVFLNAKVAAGRKAVKANTGRGMAYFEWSAKPGTDLFDVDAWWTFMPALGFTTEVDVVRDNIQIVVDDPERGPDEARRAYLNIPTAGVRTVFPPGTWDQVTDVNAAPAGKLTLALEVHPERKSAAIAAADDDHALELVEYRTGPLDWVLDRTAEIALKWSAPVVIDKGGPAATFIEPLRERGVVVIEAGTREFTQACGSFYDAVVERTIQVRKHPGADAATVAILTDDDAAMIARDEAAVDAVESARRRNVSDAWAWARKVGDHDAIPLTSMSLALWGTAHHPDDEDDSIGTFAEVI
ncbi:MAG: hypothetical protein AAGA90_07900 [Actinomycetota bacterium]